MLRNVAPRKVLAAAFILPYSLELKCCGKQKYRFVAIVTFISIPVSFVPDPFLHLSTGYL